MRGQVPAALGLKCFKPLFVFFLYLPLGEWAADTNRTTRPVYRSTRSWCASIPLFKRRLLLLQTLQPFSRRLPSASVPLSSSTLRSFMLTQLAGWWSRKTSRSISTCYVAGIWIRILSLAWKSSQKLETYSSSGPRLWKRDCVERTPPWAAYGTKVTWDLTSCGETTQEA